MRNFIVRFFLLSLSIVSHLKFVVVLWFVIIFQGPSEFKANNRLIRVNHCATG